jgi:hypothetical protein
MGIGLASVLKDRIHNLSDFGVFIGFCAHIVIGIFAVVIARNFLALEERIQRLEGMGKQ